MYIISPSKWNNTKREPANSKLLFELWLEKVGSPTCLHYELPLYSCYQLLKNLKKVISLIKEEIIDGQNLVNIANEILCRLNKDIWLNHVYQNEIKFLKEELLKAESNYKEKNIRKN